MSSGREKTWLTHRQECALFIQLAIYLDLHKTTGLTCQWSAKCSSRYWMTGASPGSLNDSSSMRRDSSIRVSSKLKDLLTDNNPTVNCHSDISMFLCNKHDLHPAIDCTGFRQSANSHVNSSKYCLSQKVVDQWNQLTTQTFCAETISAFINQTDSLLWQHGGWGLL